MRTFCILFTVIALLTICACTKVKNNCKHEGMVHYTGPVAGDGCDWLINIDGKEYHPENLTISYQQDSLLMSMDYELTGDTFFCGWGNQYPVVRFTCTYWPEL